MRSKAQRVTRPAQTRLQKLGFTVPKFTKFLPDVDGPSAVLMHACMLRFFHPLCNASKQNESGYADFRRLHQNSVTIGCDP